MGGDELLAGRGQSSRIKTGNSGRGIFFRLQRRAPGLFSGDEDDSLSPTNPHQSNQTTSREDGGHDATRQIPNAYARLDGGNLGDVRRGIGAGPREEGSRRGRQEAQHYCHHGRRHRLGEHRGLSSGPDVFDDAKPGQAGQRGLALHRLLRRAELHRRSRQLHHGRVADPHWPDHGRPSRRQDRHPRRGPDDRDGAEGDDTPRASSARTILAI